ncbi:unnamed protein product [Rhizophagus irregularis]|nr:unnamed protein product [Rhizophagus irregularis]
MLVHRLGLYNNLYSVTRSTIYFHNVARLGNAGNAVPENSNDTNYGYYVGSEIPGVYVGSLTDFFANIVIDHLAAAVSNFNLIQQPQICRSRDFVRDLANKSDKTLLEQKGTRSFLQTTRFLSGYQKSQFYIYIYIYTLFVACLYKILFNEINMENLKVLGVEAQQEVVNWFNANYNNNNDTDPVLIVIEWDVNTNLVQRTQIKNHIQVNTTVAPQSNNNPSSTLFCVTSRDAGQTVEDAISAVRRNMFQRNGVVLARIFSIKAERKDLFEIIEHWDVFA